jgi:hypothetical protein
MVKQVQRNEFIGNFHKTTRVPLISTLLLEARPLQKKKQGQNLALHCYKKLRGHRKLLGKNAMPCIFFLYCAAVF